ncbi:MAG: hypothetical protein RIE24_07370 [Silicimonas sp.]
MKRVLTIAAMLGITASAVGAAPVYFDDFEGLSAVGGAGGVESAQGYDGVNGIAGSFWRNDTKSLATTLSLSGLAAHSLMTLEFDIAFIDSWDGAIGRIYGDDFFNIVVDGVTQLITTNFGGLGNELSDGVYGFFGFREKYDDEAYRLSTTFAHSGDTADISFFANGKKWQAGLDESWAIDNLTVSTNADLSAVPLPGALPLMLGGLGLMAFGMGRRRKTATA